ncbi:MAG: DUF763 domain-containing protein [Patescibacteria group bacterium]
MYRGIATFGLDYGMCPKWLFERMVKLGREMTQVIIAEYGPTEYIRRLADPVWFQSLGTVLAFDWNASGLTTILTAALKEAIRGEEQDLGVFICGGKGKTSRKTPDQIAQWGAYLNMPQEASNNLVYNSKMSAKVDSSLLQDGYQLYHHAFFFTKDGAWTVVQQGMDTEKGMARRYHWHSASVRDLVCEPHSGIVAAQKAHFLNLAAKNSEPTRQLSTELVQSGYQAVMKEIKIIRKYFTPLSQTVTLKTGDEQLTLLNLETKEFSYHPVVEEDFSRSHYLEKVLGAICEVKPKNYEQLLAVKGVGPKTVRALALVGEVIYGAKPSFEDPARYSFAHGGKDGTPYPVDRQTYDQTIMTMRDLVNKARIDWTEKRKILDRLNKQN